MFMEASASYFSDGKPGLGHNPRTWHLRVQDTLILSPTDLRG